MFSHISIYIKSIKNKENFTLSNINIRMQFDHLYKKLINEYVIEEGLFAAAGGIAKGAVKAVAKDIAPTATAAVEFIGDQFKRGPNGKLKLEKPISVSKDMEPAQVNALLDKVATLENEVEEDLGFPIVYKNETFYYLSHDDQNLTVTSANGQTRKIPLEGLELDIVPMDQEEDAESSPGRVKRSGASCKGSVTELRKMAKKYSGEKAKMYHWCANMKGGKRKSEDAEQRIDDKCWDGYKKRGTKKKGDTRVNNCVKEAKDAPKRK